MAEMIEVAKATVTIVPNMKGAQKTIAEELGAAGESGGKKAGLSFSSALGAGVKAAGAAVAAASGAVAAFGASSVKAGAEFDASMSQVAATMGVTVDEITDLRDFAQQMGATTAFSATQAADALNYMALAGYDAQTSMDMLPNVLNLAAAGGIELAAASDMVTDASSALGLTLDETSQLVDKMAKASSLSNTSVAQLGDAILTVGGTAKNLSGGTTELSTALGILADNGVKGAEGGTALRNIILSLSAPTDKAAKMMEQLGVSAYDMDGNLRPLEDTFGDLNAALSTMTQGEQTQVLNSMFNKVDLKSVNALLSTNVERWEGLSEAIDNTDGAAKTMADTQLDNLSGDITLFQSALEGAKIAVSDQLTPSLREFVQFGSDGLSELTTAFQEDGLEGLMESFGNVLSDGVNMIIEKVPMVVDAALALLDAFGQGLIDNMPTITSAVVEILQMFVEYVIENLPTLIEAAIQIIVQLADGIIQALPELIPAIVDTVLTIADTLLDNLDLLIDAAIEIILALTDGIINALPKLIEKAPEIIIKLVDAIIRNLPKILKAGLDVIVTLGKGIWDNRYKLAEAAMKIIDHMKEKFDSFKQKFKDIGKNIINGIKDGLSNAWESVIEWIKGKAGELVDTVKSFFGIHSPSTLFRDEIGVNLALGIGEGFSDEIDNVNREIEKELQADFSAIGQADYIGADVSGFGRSITNAPVINVYASAEMDEQALAEKIGNILAQQNERARYALA